MKIKVLVIGIVEYNDQILLRKKPDGSPPYKETWYLFGGELSGNLTPERAIRDQLMAQAGIEVKLTERLGWDTEVKEDHDGEVKLFIYLDCRCAYISGEPQPAEGIEKLAWVHRQDLGTYDHVPPSRKLFQKIGYL